MKIIQLKSKNKSFSEFKNQEWEKVHVEHFGREQNPVYWSKKLLLLKAVEGKKILGVMSGEVMAGVLHIKELIIADASRGMGVGNELMKVTESKSREMGFHTMYLETGRNWKAVPFYEKFGFKIVGDLRNFYEKTDFIIMKKDL